MSRVHLIVLVILTHGMILSAGSASACKGASFESLLLRGETQFERGWMGLGDKCFDRALAELRGMAKRDKLLGEYHVNSRWGAALRTLAKKQAGKHDVLIGRARSKYHTSLRRAGDLKDSKRIATTRTTLGLLALEDPIELEVAKEFLMAVDPGLGAIVLANFLHSDGKHVAAIAELTRAALHFECSDGLQEECEPNPTMAHLAQSVEALVLASGIHLGKSTQVGKDYFRALRLVAPVLATQPNHSIARPVAAWLVAYKLKEDRKVGRNPTLEPLVGPLGQSLEALRELDRSGMQVKPASFYNVLAPRTAAVGESVDLLLQATSRALNQFGEHFVSEMRNLHPPTLEVLSPTERQIATTAPVLQILIDVKHPAPSHVIAVVNGVEQTASRIELADVTKFHGFYAVPLPLYGDNTIELIAVSQRGDRVTHNLTVTRSNATPSKRRKAFLLGGLRSFPDHPKEVLSIDEDLEGLRMLLEPSSTRSTFETVEVIQLATKATIETIQTEMAGGEFDEYLIYISGHGLRVGRTSYVLLNPAPVDASAPAAPGRVDRMTVLNFLNVLLGPREADNVAVIIDACYSGQVDGQPSFGRSPHHERPRIAFAAVRGGQEALAIVSSDADGDPATNGVGERIVSSDADGDPATHSVGERSGQIQAGSYFTTLLLRAADKNAESIDGVTSEKPDGWIMLRELELKLTDDFSPLGLQPSFVTDPENHKEGFRFTRLEEEELARATLLDILGDGAIEHYDDNQRVCLNSLRSKLVSRYSTNLKHGARNASRDQLVDYARTPALHAESLVKELVALGLEGGWCVLASNL